MSMFGNPILLERFGIAWTVAKCGLAAGGAFIVLGVVILAILFKHTKAEFSRVTGYDAAVGAMYPGIRPAPPGLLLYGKAVGYEVKMKANIDTLRKAAGRGDWLTFWLWPAMICSWCLGFWLVFMATFAVFRVPAILVIVTTGFIALIVLIALFMPWAAIYTKIDLDADTPEVAPADGTAGPSPQAARWGNRRR
jgi:hypothetical protein